MAVVDSLRHALEQQDALLTQRDYLLHALHGHYDSLLAVRDAVPTIAAQLDSPLVVKTIADSKGWLIDLIEHPLLVLIWPLLVGVVSFFAGKAYENWKAWRDRTNAKWTAARLARRYLLFSAAQLRALLKIVETSGTGPSTLSAGHVQYPLRNIADFDEVKTRMIDFEDDKLEERLYQWQAVAIDTLNRLHDYVTLSQSDFQTKYGKDGLGYTLEIESTRMSLNTDAENADALAHDLEPLIKLRKARP